MSLVICRIRREHAETMKSWDETAQVFYATTAMRYRSALEKLESGNSDGAKQELSFAIANFYHHFKKVSEYSRWIATEIGEVELQASSSAILAAALKNYPDKKTYA
jgi:hypothetical protein